MLRSFSRVVAMISLIALSSSLLADDLGTIPPIARVLPPLGVELPAKVREPLEEPLAKLERDVANYRTHAAYADVAVLLKAVRYALNLREFYNEKKDVATAQQLLQLAAARLERLRNNQPVLGDERLCVRGYVSEIDGSVQPYGIVFPKDVDQKHLERYPIYVWLHGRGDKSTDLHFIKERLSSVGQLGEVNAIVLHPFGRQCVGFKSAGEIDVLDCLRHFGQQYASQGANTAPGNTALIGFSMGGAGAWHVGAHYASHFRAVAPGAGFAETARYTKTDPATVPAYERQLWRCYDVPDYVTNLFNVRTIAYSGEKDKQIQAARVMEEAFASEGRTLTHLIGPNTEHKYEPATLAKLLAALEEPTKPNDELFWQSSTLRYASAQAANMQLKVLGLERHWSDSRVVARRSAGNILVATKNVVAFEFTTSPPADLVIDGQPFSAGQENSASMFERRDGKWHAVTSLSAGLRKQPGLQGPIDDAFLGSFLVVRPTGKSKNVAVQRWADFELQHFVTRWKEVMRGDVQTKNDLDVTDADIREHHLVCFGDPESNSVIRRAMKSIPMGWREGKVSVGEKSWSANEPIVPAFIYPNPLHRQFGKGDVVHAPKYIVVNSGLTFREAHDKTNSQQNPKLPDWAVFDLRDPPNASAAGKVMAAGFFDEAWQVVGAEGK